MSAQCHAKLFALCRPDSRAKFRGPDPSVPGFRYRTHEPEYARLGLPFCRKDSIRKLSVLLEEEAAARSGH